MLFRSRHRLAFVRVGGEIVLEDRAAVRPVNHLSGPFHEAARRIGEPRCEVEPTPFVPRGAGTGLSGGALADGAVVIELSRMNRIVWIDEENGRARVQPGLVNARLNEAVAPFGLMYAPDPSSQTACTLGGNVAENAGGPHCLKYGVTTNHILGLTFVAPNGELIDLPPDGRPGYDLVGLFVGSEGTLGICSEIELRLLPIPAAVETLLAHFDDIEAAGRAVSAIIDRKSTRLNSSHSSVSRMPSSA